MDNRSDFIQLIGQYGRECMISTASVKDDIARRTAAMKAIEDFCDAAILAEREAIALTVQGQGHTVLADAIRARPAP
jgi:hypothetical protein